MGVTCMCVIVVCVCGGDVCVYTFMVCMGVMCHGCVWGWSM